MKNEKPILQEDSMTLDILFINQLIHLGDKPKIIWVLCLKRLLKENIDGEALKWAFNKMRKKRRQKNSNGYI